MMISKAMQKRLNEQVNNEFASGWVYQQMAYAFEDLGLPVFAKFFHRQAGEEREHAEKAAKYILDQQGKVTLAALPAPPSKYKSAEDIVAAALEHEKKVTRDWNQISDLAIKEKDHATRALSNWFVEEQVEEVSTMAELLNMVQLAKTPGQLLMLEGRVWRMMESN